MIGRNESYRLSATKAINVYIEPDFMKDVRVISWRDVEVWHLVIAHLRDSEKMYIRKDRPVLRASYEKSCLSLRRYYGMTVEDSEIFQKWRTPGRGLRNKEYAAKREA